VRKPAAKRRDGHRTDARGLSSGDGERRISEVGEREYATREQNLSQAQSTIVMSRKLMSL
jgi:hypothetical protein